MKIVIETKEELKKLNRLRLFSTTDAVINANLLLEVIKDYEKRISTLKSEKYFLTNNFIEDWIDEAIEVNIENGNNLTDSEVKQIVITDVKEELAKFKAEDNYSTEVLINYEYPFRLNNYISLTPFEIIEKLEKDLAKFEVPEGAVEEVKS